MLPQLHPVQLSLPLEAAVDMERDFRYLGRNLHMYFQLQDLVPIINAGVAAIGKTGVSMVFIHIGNKTLIFGHRLTPELFLLIIWIMDTEYDREDGNDTG